MSVQNVNNNYGKYTNDLYKSGKTTGKSEDDKTKGAAKETAVSETDEFVPSTTYKVDSERVKALKEAQQQRTEAFQQMISTLFKNQGIAYDKAKGIKENLERLIGAGGVSEEERLAAQKAISEDGEYGVQKTADRILDFAKAISGGDPEKIETLKNAFIKGYEEAEKAWGGELPDICKQTYDKVMEGFDAWAKDSGNQD